MNREMRPRYVEARGFQLGNIPPTRLLEITFMFTHVETFAKISVGHNGKSCGCAEIG